MKPTFVMSDRGHKCLTRELAITGLKTSTLLQPSENRYFQSKVPLEVGGATRQEVGYKKVTFNSHGNGKRTFDLKGFPTEQES